MTPAPTPGQSSFAGSYQTAFNAAYYASKPPVFQRLYNGRPGSANPAAITLTQDKIDLIIGALIAQGWVIDEQIDYWGMDPYTTMFMRQLYGQTWEPAGMGNVSSNQVLTPGMFIGPVPAGQIKVSTLLSDYPPYPVIHEDVPVVPPNPKAANPVGIRIIPQVPSQPNFVGDVFRCAVANDGFGVGDSWDGTSGVFSGTWQKQALLAGMMIVWTKIS